MEVFSRINRFEFTKFSVFYLILLEKFSSLFLAMYKDIVLFALLVQVSFALKLYGEISFFSNSIN